MKAVLDACVLYPTVVREILLAVAARGLFTPLWSERILEEWARAARKLGPGGEAIARGEIALVKAAFPKAIIRGASATERRLHLPDVNDIHVLATAVEAGADLIVTFNATDFPRHLLAEEGIQRTDPDALLMELWLVSPDVVAGAVEEVRAVAERLSSQPQPVRKLLRRAGLPRLGKALSTG